MDTQQTLEGTIIVQTLSRIISMLCGSVLFVHQCNGVLPSLSCSQHCRYDCCLHLNLRTSAKIKQTFTHLFETISSKAKK